MIRIIKTRGGDISIAMKEDGDDDGCWTELVLSPTLSVGARLYNPNEWQNSCEIDTELSSQLVEETLLTIGDVLKEGVFK